MIPWYKYQGSQIKLFKLKQLKGNKSPMEKHTEQHQLWANNENENNNILHYTVNRLDE